MEHSSISIAMKILLIMPLIIAIAILIYIVHYSPPVFEGLNETSPLEKPISYDITNINQSYHPTYIDTNIDALGGFALPVYYEPKTYKYSSKAYVPNYVDSIYMSSLTGLSNVADYYENS